MVLPSCKVEPGLPTTLPDCKVVLLYGSCASFGSMFPRSCAGVRSAILGVGGAPGFVFDTVVPRKFYFLLFVGPWYAVFLFFPEGQLVTRRISWVVHVLLNVT